MIERRGEEHHRLFHIAKHDPEFPIFYSVANIIHSILSHTNPTKQVYKTLYNHRFNLHVAGKKNLVAFHPSVSPFSRLPAYAEQLVALPNTYRVVFRSRRTSCTTFDWSVRPVHPCARILSPPSSPPGESGL